MIKHRIDLAIKAREAVDRALAALDDEDVRSLFGFASADLEGLTHVLDEYLDASTESRRRECLADIWERTFLLEHELRRAGA